MGKLDPCDAAIVVEPDCVIDAEIVALAGDDHIIIAVIAHFAGLARQARGHGAGHGQGVALTFLAAKTTPHAAGFDAHTMHRHANGLGHFVLNFGGVLGRTMDQHIAVFLWQGGGGLAFEIEMFLPAHDYLACQAVLGLCNGWGRVALGPDGRRVLEPAVGG